MKAITVRQPWAWAIAHGGKDIENRSQNIAGDFRGLVAIHASGQPAADFDDAVYDVARLASQTRTHVTRFATELGGIIALARIVAVHNSADCSGKCSRWAQSYRASGTKVHIQIAAAEPLDAPVWCLGRLGLWTVPVDVEAQVRNVVDWTGTYGHLSAFRPTAPTEETAP